MSAEVPMMTLLGLCGSLRKASMNRALLGAIGQELPEAVALTVFDRLGEIPPYNQDHDTTPGPEPVEALRAAIAAVDGLLIVSPEYNYGLPGLLKNAIDWASRPIISSSLRGKPAGIAGASAGMGGTIRMQHQLRQVFVGTNVLVMVQPEVALPRAQERFDAEGRLTDESTRALVKKFASALVAWVGHHPRSR
jgi:chromate reductase, NAD(P)H dehydrogenase (quinone)